MLNPNFEYLHQIGTVLVGFIWGPDRIDLRVCSLCVGPGSSKKVPIHYEKSLGCRGDSVLQHGIFRAIAGFSTGPRTIPSYNW